MGLSDSETPSQTLDMEKAKMGFAKTLNPSYEPNARASVTARSHL
jgi:hypothetical protein